MAGRPPESKRRGFTSWIYYFNKKPKHERLFYVQGQVTLGAGMLVKEYFLLDCGASENFVSEKWIEKHKPITTKREQQMSIRYANGSSLYQPMVVTQLAISLGDTNSTTYLNFIVTQLESVDFILGLPWFRLVNPLINWHDATLQLRSGSKIQLAKPTRINETILSVRAEPRVDIMNDTSKLTAKEVQVDILLKEFNELFKEPQALPPHREFDHAIELIENAKVPIARMIRLSQREQAELEVQLTELLKKGFIRRSNSPYGAPVFFVPKKNNKLRLVVDWRGLNSITIKDQTPLPRVSDLLSLLGKAKFFTLMDAYSGYNQLRIKEGDQYKTAMLTPFGLYEWEVMGFGLTNGPASFQAFMNSILGDLIRRGVVVYLDDVLIYSSTIEEHLRLLEEVLRRFRHHKIYLNESKCIFATSKVTFLGHTITNGRISVAVDKVSAIQEMKLPSTKQQVRHVLGVFGFLRDHVKNFAQIALPLTRLTRKHVMWSRLPSDAIQAFHQLKAMVIEAPDLHIPNDKDMLVLACDASDEGMASVFWQLSDGVRYPVGFFSRRFDDRESKWATRDKECQAVLESVEHWSFYLKGRFFVVETDCAALQYLRSQRTLLELPQRLDRVLDKLARYDFKVVHVGGTSNAVADGLSRLSPADDIKGAQLTVISASTTQGAIHGASKGLPNAYKGNVMLSRIVNDIKDSNTSRTRYTSNKWTLNKEGLLHLHNRLLIPNECRNLKL
jgi:hypothetical protein